MGERPPSCSARIASPPPGPVWWQTCTPRELVTGRTLALPFSGDSDANLKTRERGLGKLLDWLEDQPGGNWQERWLASRAEEAGRAWMQVPMDWRRRWITPGTLEALIPGRMQGHGGTEEVPG